MEGQFLTIHLVLGYYGNLYSTLINVRFYCDIRKDLKQVDQVCDAEQVDQVKMWTR